MSAKGARGGDVTCSCCGTRMIDAVVEHVWFGLPTRWLTIMKAVVAEERDTHLARVLAAFVSGRVFVLAERVAQQNRGRLLEMGFKKQASVVLELVARGLL